MDAFTLLVNIVKAVVLVLALLTGFAYTTYFERRVVARMQQRVGPNRAGPAGLMQPIADGIKLLFKENTMPAGADRVVYLMAPVLSVSVAILAFAMIPVGDPIVMTVGGVQRVVPLYIADFNAALLYVLGMTSLAVYGIALAGWSSDNKYALLGGLRSSAQMISYELAMGLSLVGVVMVAGTLSIVEVVDQQRALWFIVLQPVGFAVYAITAVAETNRAPFDLPEAEQELIAGFHIEYTGLRFALFYMAEYIAMITVGAVAVSLFFGGYHLPCFPDGPLAGLCSLPWFLDMAVFTAKVVVVLFIFVWLRATIPRLRYDQLMNLGWKVLLPIALLNLAVTAVGLVIAQTHALW
jgi:NADH-quinone oxidoreductase subunit H